MRDPTFELFEFLCEELTARAEPVIAADDFQLEDSDDLVDELKRFYGETNTTTAFDRALDAIKAHFTARGASPPFSFDRRTREFEVADLDYVKFISSVAARRGIGGVDAVDFEVAVTKRLAERLTGSLHRVGWRRKKLTKKSEYEGYLCGLGFEKHCLEPKDKDGGFDILWLPPLGRVPLRPIVSFQCKNSYFDEKEAHSSVGRAERTVGRHTHLRNALYLVVFNDYIDDSFLGRARAWKFLPLGLSDFARVANSVETTYL